MLWLLLGLLLACALSSWLLPDSALARSAARAFDGTVSLLSRGDGDDDDGPPLPIRGAAPRREPRSQPAALSKTSAIRKRVTPLMARMAAVRYGFKCAICGETLDATWETDHIIPLSSAQTAADVERLNSLENLQPVHRIPCHQLKSSREAAGR